MRWHWRLKRSATGLTSSGSPSRSPRPWKPAELEAVVVEGERCVYDFLYVAPAASFLDRIEATIRERDSTVPVTSLKA